MGCGFDHCFKLQLIRAMSTTSKVLTLFRYLLKRWIFATWIRTAHVLLQTVTHNNFKSKKGLLILLPACLMNYGLENASFSSSHHFHHQIKCHHVHQGMAPIRSRF